MYFRAGILGPGSWGRDFGAGLLRSLLCFKDNDEPAPTRGEKSITKGESGNGPFFLQNF